MTAVTRRADGEGTAALTAGSLSEGLVHGVGARGAISDVDNGPEPWHNSSDRLGLSELGAVTRVRLGYNRALTPRLSPLSTLPERSAGGQRRGHGRRRSPWTQRARPQGACYAELRTMRSWLGGGRVDGDDRVELYSA